MNADYITSIPNFVASVQLLHPLALLAAPLVFVLIGLWSRRRRSLPSTYADKRSIAGLSFSSIALMSLLSGAWFAWSIALAKPVVSSVSVRPLIDAREFVIAIDKSGSMFMKDAKAPGLKPRIVAWDSDMAQREQELRLRLPSLYPLPAPKHEPHTPDAEMLSRFALARWSAKEFVTSRPAGDRLGVFLFDDEVFWVSPLRADRNLVARKIDRLYGTSSGSGTNFEGPFKGELRIGAFQASINHFSNWGKAKTQIVIFISDGDAGIDPERQRSLANQMTGEGRNIHIYSLVCGPETQLTNTSTQSMRNLIKIVNPQTDEFQNAVLWAGNETAMLKAFETINRLETSPIDGEPYTTNYEDKSHPFYVTGWIFFTGFLMLSIAFREGL